MTEPSMSDSEFNPYTPPKPLAMPIPDSMPAQPKEKPAPAIFTGDGRLRNGTIIWWLYFAVCSLIFGANCWEFVRLMMRFHIGEVVFSQTGLTVSMQGLALLGLFCYLCRIPLLHSFLWGLLCIAWLAHTIYEPAGMISFLNHRNADFLSWQFASFIVLYLVRLPELYALWRYSSSSSPVWKKPGVQWKVLGRKVMDMILALRRA